MLPGVQLHILFPVHFALFACCLPEGAVQWRHDHMLMLPGVQFHILLPVHSHLPLSQEGASQLPHDHILSDEQGFQSRV